MNDDNMNDNMVIMNSYNMNDDFLSIYHKYHPLEVKLKCIDMYTNGISINRICTEHNVTKTYFENWLDKVNKLKYESDEAQSFKDIISKLNKNDQIYKYNQIIDRYNTIRWLNMNMCCPSEIKIQCSELCDILQLNFKRISQLTGFSRSAIEKWYEKYKNGNLKIISKESKTISSKSFELEFDKSDCDIDNLLKSSESLYDQMNICNSVSNIHEFLDTLKQKQHLSQHKIYIWVYNKRVLKRRYEEARTYLSAKKKALKKTSKLKSLKDQYLKSIKSWSKLSIDISILTKIRIINLFETVNSFSYKELAQIFNVKPSIIQKCLSSKLLINHEYQARQEKQKNRLNCFKSNKINHYYEITQLDLIVKFPDPLALLESYLNEGQCELPCIKLTKCKNTYETESLVIEFFRKRQKELIISSCTPMKIELFQTISSNYIEILQQINDRYLLLMDRLNSSNNNDVDIDDQSNIIDAINKLTGKFRSIVSQLRDICNYYIHGSS